ncbi:MAG: HAD-IA family hydrolase [Candidatus Zixiibacteriota bacterium]
MKATHLIFDLDGTLIDSSAGVIEAVNYAYAQVGQTPPDEATIRKIIGYPLEQLFREHSDYPERELYDHFQVHAAESVVGATVALDGADATLRALHAQGYIMGIATTKIRSHVHKILTKLGWEELFDTSIGGDDVRRVKPEPDAFLLAMERMSTSPSQSIVIGDTENDVLAAKAIPMRVIAVKSPYGGHEKLADMALDHFIDHLSELLPILGNGLGDPRGKQK